MLLSALQKYAPADDGRKTQNSAMEIARKFVPHLEILFAKGIFPSRRAVNVFRLHLQCLKCISVDHIRLKSVLQVL